MRFTLPKLFLAVALAALACAGMFSPTHWWASSIISLTVALFLLTAIRAIGLRGRERVFAITFAIVGGGYLLAATCFQSRIIARFLVTNYPLALFALAQESVPIATVPTYYPGPTRYAPAVSSGGSVSIAPISPGAPTFVAPPTYSAPVPPSSTSTVTPPSTAILPSPPVPALSRQSIPLDTVILMGLSYDDEQLPLVRMFLIGHCVWSWLIALLAGWFAGRVYARRQN
jgi:hypothetical protein